MIVRVTSKWIWQEVYDYQIEDQELPANWDTMTPKEKGDWAYLITSDSQNVESFPLDELSVDEVDVIW